MNRQLLSNKDFYNLKASVDHYSTKPELHPKERVAFSFIPAGAFVLDIGCGAGRTTCWLNEQGYRVIGLDISHSMVKKAAEHHPLIPFVTGDAVKLGFHSHMFDAVVFSFNGLDCIYPYADRITALQEIKRVLKPNGLFIFSAHNHCIPRDREGIGPFFSTLLKKHRGCYIQSAFGSNRFNIYLTTPDQQIQELQSQGFEIVDIVPRRLLRAVKHFSKIIGLLDDWIYYVCKAVD